MFKSTAAYLEKCLFKGYPKRAWRVLSKTQRVPLKTWYGTLYKRRRELAKPLLAIGVTNRGFGISF